MNAKDTVLGSLSRPLPDGRVSDNDAPIGACIRYAISCGLSDKNLADRHEILVRSGRKAAGEEDETESAGEDED